MNVQDVHLDVHVDLGRAGGLLVQPPHQLQLLLKQLLFLASHLKVRLISDQAYGENGKFFFGDHLQLLVQQLVFLAPPLLHLPGAVGDHHHRLADQVALVDLAQLLDDQVVNGRGDRGGEQVLEGDSTNTTSGSSLRLLLFFRDLDCIARR